MEKLIGKKVAIVDDKGINIGYIAAVQSSVNVKYLTKSSRTKLLVADSPNMPFGWWETRFDDEVKLIEETADVEV